MKSTFLNYLSGVLFFCISLPLLETNECLQVFTVQKLGTEPTTRYVETNILNPLYILN